jgi:hypothetical protein
VNRAQLARAEISEQLIEMHHIWEDEFADEVDRCTDSNPCRMCRKLDEKKEYRRGLLATLGLDTNNIDLDTGLARN